MLVWSSLRMNFSSKHRRLAIWKDPVFIVLRTGSQRYGALLWSNPYMTKWLQIRLQVYNLQLTSYTKRM
ncbi:hypothetical protein QR680_015086 [Steinernema hermaphroditum]|uniref:Uncharacterized protein n=1 Tax=Steinernema hermaphroditum TaxID=289476 RepID=A0AA39M4B6_9BILA|nr:hypothetical protein QR680_015086 [Steinernema hermaphroditum]